MKRRGLVLDVKSTDWLTIGGVTRIEMLQKSGQTVRLRITAPPDVEVRLHKDEAQESDHVTSHVMWEKV